VVVGVPEKRKLVRVQVFLPEDIAKRFEAEAEARGLSLSSYLRAWIIEKLRAEDKGVPKASNSDRPMTERQRAYIQSLIRRVSAEAGLEPSQLREMAEMEMGFRISEDMSMAEASKLIDWLKRWLSEASQE